MEPVNLEALASAEHPIIEAARDLSQKPTPPRLSRNLAQKAKEQRERGFVFELRSMGATAIVKKLSLGERATIGALPDHIQRKVLQALADAAESKSARTNDGGIDLAQALGNLGRAEDAINVVCVAGFIDPKLILSEATRTHEDEILVSDIDYADRARYFAVCNGDDDEVKALTPFLGAAGDAAQPVADR